MATDKGGPALEGLLDGEHHDVEALERLEGRILETVEQLREARRKQTAAEREVAKLREELAEKNRLIEKLESERSEVTSGRKVVRSRIESLLERLDSIEQSGSED